MSSINNDYTSMFDSLYGTSSSQNTSNMNFLGDWASLKNGSMAKLTKAYYAKNSDAAEGASKDASAIKESIKANNRMKSDAEDLKKSLSGVKNVDDLKKFVEKYNAMISSGAESDNRGVLRNTLSMTQMVEKHSNSLADLGITIGEDNKLSLNESIAEKADKSVYKALFDGVGSLGDMIAGKASGIVNSVNAENNKLSNYTQGGTFANAGAVGNIYDGSY
ncbi:MAG: hypothetical protein J5518_02145 [Lachnospiraceae bacterium]|nr:hypothetical protein [Lachnospiraceae bacterium]